MSEEHDLDLSKGSPLATAFWTSSTCQSFQGELLAAHQCVRSSLGYASERLKEMKAKIVHIALTAKKNHKEKSAHQLLSHLVHDIQRKNTRTSALLGHLVQNRYKNTKTQKKKMHINP